MHIKISEKFSLVKKIIMQGDYLLKDTLKTYFWFYTYDLE